MQRAFEPNSNGDSDLENRWRNGFENIDARWRKRLLTAQQLLRVLQRAFEPNSAGDSENRERIWFRKDRCAMVKARWPGISTAMISTLEDVLGEDRIAQRWMRYGESAMVSSAMRSYRLLMMLKRLSNVIFSKSEYFVEPKKG